MPASRRKANLVIDRDVAMSSSQLHLDVPLQAVVAAPPAMPTAGEEEASAVLCEPSSPGTMAEIPAVLERSSFEHHLREFTHQFQPAGHLEMMIVRDMARQVSAAEAWHEGVGALHRQRAQRIPAFVSEGEDNGELEDCALAAAVSSPAVHLAEQHEQKRSRAFYRALRTLLELQARRKSCERAGELVVLQDHFPTEAACEQYLRKRFEQGLYQCPRCGCRRGHYIPSRRCWECGGCKRQTGLRSGTVAADSPLSLVTWFRAVRLLLSCPTMGPVELGIKLGISRSTTVRSMVKKVVSAMAADNSSQPLAGLDTYFARCAAEAPESGDLEEENSASRAEERKTPPGAAVSACDAEC